MPAESVSRSVPVLGARHFAEHGGHFVDGPLEAGHEQHVETLELRLRAQRDGHPAPLDAQHLQLPRKLLVAEILQRPAFDLLAGHQNLRLIDRNVERLRIRHLRPDQPHVFGQILQTSAERDHIAGLQTDVRIGAHRWRRSRTTLTIRYWGFEPRNWLIVCPVSALFSSR